MSKIKDIFNFDNTIYQRLKEPSRAVSKAYLDGNRFLDTTKEFVYIEYGLKYCSDIIHRQAHICLERLDVFGDLLHERHLIQLYPATPELDYREELKSMDDVFSFVIRVLDSIEEALEVFHETADNEKFRPMALKIEELMLQNSMDHTKFLEMWMRYDTDRGSLTSFDSWCKQFLEEVNDE
jgi:hypothetical protein